MDTTTLPDAASLANLLTEAQAKHSEHLRQVEQAQAQLAAVHQKLQAAEAELVKLANMRAAAVPDTANPTQPTPSTTKGVSLILNPAAKCFADGLHSPEEIMSALQAVGIQPQLELTTLEIDAHQLARKALDRGDTLVIAAGGDGTIEEVAMGLLNSKAALGIMPLGTMNNVARSLGIPLDVPNAALLLAMGATRHIDVGHVITSEDSISNYFLETAGIGLSALATPMGEDAEKGRWSDVLSKLGEFFSFSAVGVRISCDDDESTLDVRTNVVTVSNAPLFGANMLVAPDAKMDDGLLDLAFYEGMELVDLTRYFYGISNGGQVTDVRVHHRSVRRIRITADAPLAVNADLDVLDKQREWEIEVLPQALTVVVGNGLGLTFPVEAAPATPPLTGPQPESNNGTAM